MESFIASAGEEVVTTRQPGVREERAPSFLVDPNEKLRRYAVAAQPTIRGHGLY